MLVRKEDKKLNGLECMKNFLTLYKNKSIKNKILNDSR